MDLVDKLLDLVDTFIDLVDKFLTLVDTYNLSNGKLAIHIQYFVTKTNQKGEFFSPSLACE